MASSGSSVRVKPGLDAEQAAESTSADLVIVHRRYPGRWAAAIIVLFIVGLMLDSVFTNEHFGWKVVGHYLFELSILRGAEITLLLTIISMVIGIVLGTILAVMRLSPNPVVQSAASAYIFFFRGTPLLVQLLFWYNLSALYPVITFDIPGVSLNANHFITPLIAAILGLGLNEGAYMAEIVRAGIFSVGRGQFEASGALGMPRMLMMRRIVLPQAMRVIVPPTGNEVIGMLKNTSLVSVMAVPDLLYSSQIIYSRNFETIPLLMVACVWYLVLTAILGVGQYYIERKYSQGTASSSPSLLQWLSRNLPRLLSSMTRTGKGL